MRIICKTTFLDGPRRYEADDVCTVPDADGARFCAHGWAKQEDSPAAEAPESPPTVSLSVDSVSVGHAATKAGS